MNTRHLASAGLLSLTFAVAFAAPAAAQAPPDSYFQKIVLDANVNQPTELSVAPDGRVFFLDRTGKIRVYRPASQTTITSGTFSVDVTGNHGMLALALDPGFATNHWLYVYYSPVTPSVTRLSRYTVAGDAIDPASQIVMLEVPTQRICCHEGSSISFGSDGNLYISTGDNTDPFESSGYAPIDERPGRETFDSQRSTANSQDLRGKILRIRPQANGTYTIPSGNLFSSTAQGRLEIYSMGMRNPFRITVDPTTNWVYFGDVGPDASVDGAGRGPKGYDEFNQVKSAGNYGWPYCIADNKPYNDFNFATGVSGPAFNCAAPVNNSPNNTGLTSLPAARPAWIWYPYGASVEFPQMGNAGGRAAMVGFVYHFNASQPSTKLPSYYDNRLFIFDWSRGWIQSVQMDANGAVVSIERFLGSFTFSSPIDATVGPDGALYLLEWGAGVGHESGPDAKLSRIEFKGPGGANPVAFASGTPNAGAVPLAVNLSSAGSFDPESGALTYAWDFTADGTTDSTSANPSFTYNTAGNYNAKLTVTDPEGKTGTATVPITAGNSRPVVTLSSPPNGGFFSWNEQISFNASVTDVEDGSTPTGIACNSVQIVPGLGHDSHSHTNASVYGCQGTLVIPPLPIDHADGDVSWIVEGSYADRGGSGGAAAQLTGNGIATLQPKHKQAEHFTAMTGVQVQTTGDSQGGGENVWDIQNGDWIAFAPMNLQNITQVTYRTASAGLGGTIEVHVDSPTGTLLSTASIPVTGGWQTYTNVTAAITNPGGTHGLYFVFKGGAPPTALFNVNWIDFVGAGVSTPVNGGDSGVGTTYEAEYATRSGVTVETLNAGFTGTGYADYASTPTSGTFIEWNVNAPTTGTYSLEFRYANAGSNRPLEIKVGGTVVASSLAFNGTGSWTTWSKVRVNATLAAGSNLVRATTIGSSGPNIDSLSLPVYQAEVATLSSVVIESQWAGYTGTAYANYQSVTGGYIEWTIDAPTAGAYTLELRYALGAGTNRSLEIKVGTTVINPGLAFTPTGAWSAWSTKTVTATLAAGANKVRATATGVDGPNMDGLTRR
jgi:cytochrome c